MNTVKPSFSTISLTLGEPMQELQNPRIDWSQSISSQLFLGLVPFSFLRLRSSFLRGYISAFFLLPVLKPFCTDTDCFYQFCWLGCSCICLNLFPHKLFPLMFGPLLLWLSFLCLPSAFPLLMYVFITSLMGTGTIFWGEVPVNSRFYTVDEPAKLDSVLTKVWAQVFLRNSPW